MIYINCWWKIGEFNVPEQKIYVDDKNKGIVNKIHYFLIALTIINFSFTDFPGMSSISSLSQSMVSGKGTCKCNIFSH